MNVFTINEHGCHLTLSHVTIYINFLTTFQGGSTLNLALIGQAVSEKKMFYNNS